VQPIVSATGKRWFLEGLEGPEDALALVNRLRRQRSLQDEGKALSALYLPSLYADATRAADRVHEAMQAGERIGVFGDYDCDGVTSTAQLVRFFRRRGIEPVVRLPHRVHDGYGLKPKHVEAMYHAGVGLLLTVDTGISAHEAMLKAKEFNIDVIILDHHHVPAQLPEAYAVLHPQLCDYPLPHPSAAGVVFEFLHTLEQGEWNDRANDLALATFGTVADLVPLLGRNRLLVQEGLRAMAHLPPGPIASLVDFVTEDPTTLTSTDIAFRIAPRLNAAGRMADPLLALHAVLEGGAYLHDLEKLNTDRQLETKKRWAQAIAKFATPIASLPPLMMSVSKDYQPGIVGLLAGKITEQFGRPSMVAHLDGDIVTASLRSTPAYNIVKGLEKFSHLLLTFGGHAQAAGCTLRAEALQQLVQLLGEDIAAEVPQDELAPALSIDGMLHPQDISLSLCNHIASMGPFGHSNMEPLILLPEVSLQNIRQVGGDQQHLQAMLGQNKVIGFHLGHLAEMGTNPLDIVARIGIDRWNGRMTPQLSILDMRVAQPIFRETEILSSKS
jgi:single-stranded-DNA-specific exonuclease